MNRCLLLTALTVFLFTGCDKHEPERAPASAKPKAPGKTAAGSSESSAPQPDHKAQSSDPAESAALKALLKGGPAAARETIMDQGRRTKAEANIATLVGYLLVFSATNTGRFPSAAAGLRTLVTKGILQDEALLTDPWGEPIEYKVPASRSKEKFDVFSKGPNKISGDEDDIGNWSLAPEN